MLSIPDVLGLLISEVTSTLSDNFYIYSTLFLLNIFTLEGKCLLPKIREQILPYMSRII